MSGYQYRPRSFILEERFMNTQNILNFLTKTFMLDLEVFMKRLTALQVSLIKQTINFKHGEVVRISIPNTTIFNKHDSNENVYLISTDGTILWQISASEGSVSPIDVDPFVSIKLCENNKLAGQRFSGNFYEIDVKSGTAKQTSWDK